MRSCNFLNKCFFSLVRKKKYLLIIKKIEKMKKLNSLNLGKGLTRNEMKVVGGGTVAPTFKCYCDGYYMGDATSIQQCLGICIINGC